MDQVVPLPFPVGGIDVTNEENLGRPNTTTQAINVRTRDTIHSRLRGGSRPGLSRFIDAKVGGATSVIQHLNAITTVNGDALPANQWDADRERFYAGDPSVPLEEGWVYVGAVDFPHDVDVEWIDDPTTGSRPKKGKIPKKGSGDPPPFKPNKARPIIKWATPASIEFPTPLTALQLDAVAQHPETREVVPGTYAYNPPKGTILAVGVARVLRLVFNPTDIAKYWPVTAKNAITVTTYASGTTYYPALPDPDAQIYPRVLNVLFERGSDTWGTTATNAEADGDPPIWIMDNLPYVLLDRDNGNEGGILRIRSTNSVDISPGSPYLPGTITAGTTCRFWVLTSNPVRIGYVVSFDCGLSGRHETAGVFTAGINMTTNPLALDTQTVADVFCRIADGSSGDYDEVAFSWTVTGPGV